MVKHSQWSDEYWLLLMQLYLKKPVGAKALYSKGLVNLALELHIKPQFLSPTRKPSSETSPELFAVSLSTIRPTRR